MRISFRAIKYIIIIVACLFVLFLSVITIRYFFPVKKDNRNKNNDKIDHLKNNDKSDHLADDTLTPNQKFVLDDMHTLTSNQKFILDDMNALTPNRKFFLYLFYISWFILLFIVILAFIFKKRYEVNDSDVKKDIVYNFNNNENNENEEKVIDGMIIWPYHSGNVSPKPKENKGDEDAQTLSCEDDEYF